MDNQGLQSIFDAMVAQQMQSPPVVVDEMQQGQQALTDQMKEIAAVGEQQYGAGEMLQGMMASDPNDGKNGLWDQIVGLFS